MVKITVSTYSEKLNGEIIINKGSERLLTPNGEIPLNSIPVYTEDGLSEYTSIDEVFNNSTLPTDNLNIVDNIGSCTMSNAFYQGSPHINITPYSNGIPTPTPLPLYPSEQEVTRMLDVGFLSSMDSFMNYIQTLRTDGFFMATFGKSFGTLIVDGLNSALKAVGLFITGNGDIFFLMPALTFLFATFLFGRNRFTKWIIPLSFMYAISRVAFKIISSIA